MFDSCRICLLAANEADCLNVYLQMKDDKSVLDVIKECSSIEVSENDYLPKLICPKCVEKLASLYEFRNLIIKSDRHWKKKLGNKKGLFDDPLHNIVKEEIVSIDDFYKKNVLIDQCRSREMFVKDCDEHLLPDANPDLNQLQEIQTNDKDTDIKDIELKEENDVFDLQDFEDTSHCIIKEDNLPTDDVNEEKVFIAQCRSREVFVKDCDEDLLPELNLKLNQPQKIQVNNKETDIKDCRVKEESVFDLQDSEVTSLRALRIVEELSKGRRIKKESYECEICHKTYKAVDALKKHVMIHTGIKPFSCEFCGKSFLTNCKLNIHRRVHTGERPHSCKECGKKFGSPSTLINHKRSHGKVEKKIQCEICDLKFYTNWQMKFHMRRHAGKKQFMCEICSKTLSDKSTLIRHREGHLQTEANFPCSVCGKAFKSQLNLRVHTKTHSGLRPHSCEECGKTFTARPSLNRHKILHTGVKSHTCNACGKSFSLAHVLRRHMRIHSEEKPYLCPACPKEFNFKHNLQDLVRIHHRDVAEVDLVNSGKMGDTVGGS